jgi:hypothetical protein
MVVREENADDHETPAVMASGMAAETRVPDEPDTTSRVLYTKMMADQPRTKKAKPAT